MQLNAVATIVTAFGVLEDAHVIARSASDEAIHLSAYEEAWIASRSLSSGARSRDPLARNDEGRILTPILMGFCIGVTERIFRGMTAAVINRSIARPPNASNRRLP
jgi:hypothetical protein